MRSENLNGTQTAHTLHQVAQDFLEIARQNGQTTACFQIAIPELEKIAHHFGPDTAEESRDLIASRLRTSLRGSDHVFSHGDTRFTVLISPGYRMRLDSLIDLGKRLQQAAETSLSLAGTTQTLTACVGIASSLHFGRTVTADIWLTSATEALDEALSTGASATRLWSDRLSREHRSHQTMQIDLVAALDEGAIQAFFQPQINIRTGMVTGMEIFARWDHPKHGVLTAAEFLQAARDSKQMPRLGRSMLLQAVTTLHEWDEAGFDVRTISLNLSEEELRDPDLPALLGDDLARCRLPAHRIVFDIPEHVVATANDDVIRRNLVAIAELGCGLDLEGFGIGGCSVIAVQQTPVTRLKLDKSLIRGVGSSEDKKRALHAVLAISERLDLPTIAAGVETLEEHGTLRELGCSTAQGFLFAPPANASDTTLWLKEREASENRPSTAQIRRVK